MIYHIVWSKSCNTGISSFNNGYKILGLSHNTEVQTFHARCRSTKHTSQHDSLSYINKKITTIVADVSVGASKT